MKHFYENVPRLGNVAVSRYAQAQMIEAGISQEAFDRVLLEPTRPDIPVERVGLLLQSGGGRSEYQAAFRMVIASMLARASAGVW